MEKRLTMEQRRETAPPAEAEASTLGDGAAQAFAFCLALWAR